MYNFNTTFMQRWRGNLVVVGIWYWLVYETATRTTDVMVYDGFVCRIDCVQKVAPYLVNPDYPTGGAIALGLVWLFLSAIVCSYNQFIFERDIKRMLNIRRRIRNGEFEGDGNWS